MLIVICNLPQLACICIFDTNCIQNNPSSPQVLSMRLYIVLGFAISDHHSNLRYFLRSSASSFPHKVFVRHEFQAFTGHGAAPPVRQFDDVVEDVVLVLKGVEQKLCEWIVTVLDKADADVIRADIKAIEQREQKLADLLEVLSADAPRAIDQEDDVCHSLFGTD